MGDYEMVYEIEITIFGASIQHEKICCENVSQAVSVVKGLPEQGAVIFVAALEGHHDYGNFYLFLNETGAAYAEIHEHREYYPKDPLTCAAFGQVDFRYEDGSPFSVEAGSTTSVTRGRMALEYWLVNQDKWPEFEWI